MLKRRIFFRAPVHHGQTEKGIAEPKVVVRYWIISLILTLLAALTIKVR
jgi:phospho-N-acetylmuramoyl-pentapeptide-transferase